MGMTDPRKPSGPKPPGTGPSAPGPGDTERQTGITVKTRPRTERPSMYKVLLLNDGYKNNCFIYAY